MAAYAEVRTLPVARLIPEERAQFIRRTYTHLAGAIGAFIGIEYLLINSPFAPAMLKFISGSRYAWLLILGGFIIAGWMARGLASGSQSRNMQYLGLALYVLVEAVIFVPILTIAVYHSSPDVLPSAAIITGLLFTGLTAVVLITQKDFSFLRTILAIGGFVALGLIISSVLFGFTLGVVFSGAMVVLASAAILYDTSKIMRTYSTDQYVGAALELFASVALLFWYILRIVMRTSRR